MTEVFINDSIIDVDQETTVVASYGNISFGQLGKRKGTKTNNWNAPFSQRNKLVFEGAEISSSWSEIPYRRATIRVDVDGVTVFEGWCVLSEAKDSYEIVAFANSTDFYSVVTTHKLKEVDLSLYDHVWNETVIQGSWNNSSGYIYAFVEYNKHFVGSVPPEYLLPQIYFKDVVKAIVTFAGYTMTGDVLMDPRFNKHMIIPGTFPLPYSYGSAVTLNAYLPDVLMSKIWLDFTNIYGLQFDIDDQTNEIVANYIDDILFNPPEDWTSKIDRSEKPKTSFRFDSYGQKSYLRYADVKINQLTLSGFSKEVLIDDTTLKDSADIYKSEFSIIQDDQFLPSVDNTFSFNTKGPYVNLFEVWDSSHFYSTVSDPVVWYFGTYYTPIADNTNKVPSSEPTFWKVVSETDIWSMISRNLYGLLELFPSSTNKFRASTGDITIPYKITNNTMSWEYTYQNHYRVFDRIIKRTKIVEWLVKLSYTDISQIDFTRSKLIDGELYVAENINQYKLNKKDSTIVEMVRL